MAAGVAMPEVVIAKPSIGVVSDTESQSSVRPEDKVCRQILSFASPSEGRVETPREHAQSCRSFPSNYYY